MDLLEPDDILVLICDPQMDIWLPLREWIRRGQSPRKVVRPIAAKHVKTGESLPLPSIPLAVRHDPESWDAVRLGWIQDPEWPNEYYSATIEQVDVDEAILCVLAKGEKRTVVIADDTELLLLQSCEY